MSGDSGSSFTVTFGSSGRVLKRSGSCSDDKSYGSASRPVLGSKRSIKDRLETKGIESLDDRNRYKYKRQKEQCHQANWNTNVVEAIKDTFLEEGDLRHKILKKNLSRNSKEIDQSQTVDLRDKLSRRTKIKLSPVDSNVSHPSKTTSDTKKNIFDSRDSSIDRRQSMVKHRIYDGEKNITRGLRDAYANERQRGAEFRDASATAHERQRRPEFRDASATAHERQRGPEFRDAYVDERQSTREHGNAYNHGRQGMESRDSCESCDQGKPCVQEPIGSYDRGIQHGLGSVPYSTAGSNRTTVDLVRDSHSSWALENPRQRSPDRVVHPSIPKPFFPERNVDEMQKVAMINSYSDGTSNLYRRTDIPSPPRANGFGAFLMHPASHAVSSLPARPMPMVVQYPQMSGFAQSIPYAVEQQPTLAGFLQSLGLEKYIIHFRAEEVDFHALKQMSDPDLKELNIPMGPRKKIIQALTPQLRRS